MGYINLSLSEHYIISIVVFGSPPIHSEIKTRFDLELKSKNRKNYRTEHRKSNIEVRKSVRKQNIQRNNKYSTFVVFKVQQTCKKIKIINSSKIQQIQKKINLWLS